MESPAIISNGSIEQPRLWRLALQLDKDALQAVDSFQNILAYLHLLL